MKEADAFTAAGAGPRQFNTTHWSVVLQAGDSRSPQGAAALELLCRTYWHPLYAFIRRQGTGPDDAQDLTQQFFARLLERRDLGAIDPSKGRFRTFLLTALTHFLSNQRDYERAAKRGGGQPNLPLDEDTLERAYQAGGSLNLTPDQLFDVRWGMTVMEQALERLRSEMVEAGKLAAFEILRPFLTDDPEAGEYGSAAQQIGLSNQAVAVAVHRLRARYRALVRAEVAQTVSNPGDLEAELRHLFEALTL